MRWLRGKWLKLYLPPELWARTWYSSQCSGPVSPSFLIFPEVSTVEIKRRVRDTDKHSNSSFFTPFSPNSTCNSASFLFLLWISLSSYPAVPGLSFSSPVTTALWHTELMLHFSTIDYLTLWVTIAVPDLGRPDSWQHRRKVAPSTPSCSSQSAYFSSSHSSYSFLLSVNTRQYYLNLITHQ